MIIVEPHLHTPEAHCCVTCPACDIWYNNTRGYDFTKAATISFGAESSSIGVDPARMRTRTFIQQSVV